MEVKVRLSKFNSGVIGASLAKWAAGLGDVAAEARGRRFIVDAFAQTVKQVELVNAFHTRAASGLNIASLALMAHPVNTSGWFSHCFQGSQLPLWCARICRSGLKV